MDTYEAQLAQWKIERGKDIKSNAWGFVTGLLFTIPPLALLAIPYGIYASVKGNRMIREGEAENGSPRPRVQRGSKFVPAVKEEVRGGPGLRRFEASIHPPTR